MPHHHHRFSFENRARLDTADRLTRQPPAPLVDLFCRWQPTRVLDLGAGTGFFALPLARALPRAVIVVADAEPRMLEVIQQKAKELGCLDRMAFQTINPNAPQLGPERFDAVLLASVFHELGDRMDYLAQIRQHMGTNGHLVVCDWKADPAHTAAGPPRAHRVPEARAQEELGRAGFATVTPEAIYSSHYVLVATNEDGRRVTGP